VLRTRRVPTISGKTEEDFPVLASAGIGFAVALTARRWSVFCGPEGRLILMSGPPSGASTFEQRPPRANEK
jgi:hypothetical protein